VCLDDVLRDVGLNPTGGSPLFRLVEYPSAASMFQSLGEHGILARHFPDQPNRLRLGLPPDDATLDLLRQALDVSRAAVN
jgi:cobalamin biosynthetic protein CobC